MAQLIVALVLLINARTFVIHVILLKHLAIFLDFFVVDFLVFGLSGSLDEFDKGLFLLVDRDMLFFFLVVYIKKSIFEREFMKLRTSAVVLMTYLSSSSDLTSFSCC